MNKLKIMNLITRLNIGGPAAHTILLTEGLNNDRFESILLTGVVDPKEGDMRYYAEERGVKPIFIQGLGRELSLFNDLKAFWNIFKLIKKENPDIIHTHSSKVGTLARLAALIYKDVRLWSFVFRKKNSRTANNERRTPILIHTFHGHVFHSYFSPLKTRFFLFIERILALFTDRIIALSQSQLEELSGRYRVAPREKFVVIPLGLELSPFLEVERQKGRLRRELGLSSDTLLVGIMGRFAPIKNHRMLLDTIALLRARSQKPIAKFIFIGDGELREELEDYARGLGIGKDVVFLGWRSDLDNIYADLDIVALCSKNEGTPTAIIEAMAAGKAVVATDSGGVSGLISGGIRALSPVSGRFLIGERGLVVGNGDREGFACALMELAHNVNLRRELGEKARAHAKQVYTKERLIRDMEGLYVDLLSVFRI